MRLVRLKGNITYVLTFENGWIRIYNTILRWNTVVEAGCTLLSLTRIRRIV